MGNAQLVITGTPTRTLWDTLLTDLAAFLTSHSALNLKIDKTQSTYQETPP